MPNDIPLMLQTVYADLLDRVTAGAFAAAFPADGTFTAKTVRGRRYWYFQAPAAEGRAQRYVGPETPELLQRVEAHRAHRNHQGDRRGAVSMLVRSGNLPRPPPLVGDVVAALAEAGVFRLRGVLVGTIAYQTYAAMLGVRLPEAMQQTGDIDVAQFADVSAAIGDSTPPVLDVLRAVDPSFGPVPRLDPSHAVSYRAQTGLRVDFLTPNRGRETEEPQRLPAFGTDALPLRFLDFLIRDPEPAVLLHGAGILISVPAPQRYALHKLIVARRRREDAKREKDLLQAQALLDVLIRRRPYELRAAWTEAFGRGKTWQRLIGEGLGLVHPHTRDGVLRITRATRAHIPGLAWQPIPNRESYDAATGETCFFVQVRGYGGAAAEGVRCCVAKHTLESAFGPGPFDRAACLSVVRRHRQLLEQAARMRYLTQPVGADAEVTITEADLASPAASA